MNEEFSSCIIKFLRLVSLISRSRSLNLSTNSRKMHNLKTMKSQLKILGLPTHIYAFI